MFRCIFRGHEWHAVRMSSSGRFRTIQECYRCGASDWPEVLEAEKRAEEGS